MIEPTEAGARLRAAREALGLSQTEAATQLGMSRPYLADVEAGRRVPAWTRVLEMVEGLGLDGRVVAPEFFRRARRKGRVDSPP